jgi:hypothetical protein
MDVHPTKNVSIGIDPYPYYHMDNRLDYHMLTHLWMFIHFFLDFLAVKTWTHRRTVPPGAFSRDSPHRSAGRSERAAG